MTTWPRPPLTPLSQISPIVIWSPLRKKQCLIVAPRHHIMTQHCQKLCLCGNLVDLKSNGRCVTEPDSSASSSCYTRFVTPEIALLLCCNVIMGEYHGYHQICPNCCLLLCPLLHHKEAWLNSLRLFKGTLWYHCCQDLWLKLFTTCETQFSP